jgi:uncharacterized membrane-anchored protein YjiN (DUF445 family)
MSAGRRRRKADEPQAAESSHEVPSEEFQQALQEEVAQAVQPVLDDLQGEIAQFVRQHMEQGDNTSETQSEQTEPVSSGDVFQQAAEALRETFESLGRTLRALLETVYALLRAVVALLRAILAALAQGLRSLWQSILNALRARIIQAILARVRQWLQALFDRLVSWLNPVDLVQRLAKS